MLILNIETSTNACSVAVADGDEIIFNRCSSDDAPSHASLLGVYADEAMVFLRDKGLKTNAVAVSSGPGSYTGLRIGASQAKGLCYALGVPLIAVPTLQVLAQAFRRLHPDKMDGLFVPMIDARRMEVYACVLGADLMQIRDTQADIVTKETYEPFLEQGKVYFFGNGSQKCTSVIQHENAVFVIDIQPTAEHMAMLSTEAFRRKQFADVAYFEPFYLKEFIPTTPKNKVLGATQK